MKTKIVQVEIKEQGVVDFVIGSMTVDQVEAYFDGVSAEASGTGLVDSPKSAWGRMLTTVSNCTHKVCKNKTVLFPNLDPEMLKTMIELPDLNMLLQECITVSGLTPGGNGRGEGQGAAAGLTLNTSAPDLQAPGSVQSSTSVG